jgi:hypothetical protein
MVAVNDDLNERDALDDCEGGCDAEAAAARTRAAAALTIQTRSKTGRSPLMFQNVVNGELPCHLAG